jgi:hypothetical protein
MGSFKKEDIYNGNLSLEHVPPKSIKPVIKTMTCTQCNNTIGTKLQRFMVNDVRRKELEAGRVLKPIPAKVQLQGIEFDMQIVSTKGNKWQAESPVSILPPDLKSMEDGGKFVGATGAISLKNIGTKETVDRAYLHSSYLALFSLLGYPYIMQPFMAEIRQQINEGQASSAGFRINVPTRLKPKLPFIDPREKRIEVSLIGTAPDPDKSCFALVVAGELVLMPFINDHSQVIHSDFNSLLSDLAANAKRSLPFHISLLEIDPLCKYSIRYIFEKGRQIDNWNALKLSPAREKDGTH